ncbi:MAG TPA: TetR family transcriptional regulator [Blastocatellia bacterium]|nr:TetR family transcriptional regulator [Blastocatellia bacterium]
MQKKPLHRRALRRESGEAGSKGEQTRSMILETALKLFGERGYEETTMRAVAEKAGVALGNTYYHFRSKEHLIQAYYERMHELHLDSCAELLKKERTLKGRLQGVMRRILENMAPYHQFAGILFKTAADPQSPLNPFSPESEHTRRANIELFAEVVKGAKTKIPPDLEAELPTLLWLYHMGIVLFWIHDDSIRQDKTRRLMESSVEIVVRLIQLASLPLMGPLRKSVLKTLTDLRA